MANESKSSSEPYLAPPPVSFEYNSATAPPKVPQSRSSQNSTPFNTTPDQGVNSSIPLSLTAKDLSLQESKTYMRWYLDILARTESRTISIADVYHFLGNFRISESIKTAINRIFAKIFHSVNIGEFFALLRVISHALQGQSPSRGLIKVPTDVPTPPSILWKKRQNEDNESEEESIVVADQNLQLLNSNSGPLDLDLFTQFMLTGERPGENVPKKRLKKLKTVKFSDEVETNYADDFLTKLPSSSQSDTIDYSLPMDQLMSRMNAAKASTSTLQVPVDNGAGKLLSPDPEERQILQDMESQMNHFQNLHSVDTILVGGVPSNIHLHLNSDFSLPRNMLPQPVPLKPNMTGPAQMAQMGLYNGVRLEDADFNYTDPTLEGPQRMASLFAPTPNEAPKITLESFTSQMTGNLPQQNDPSATPRVRSLSHPNPIYLHSQWLEPNSDINTPPPRSLFTSGIRSASLSPRPPIPPRAFNNSQGRPAPPPPRARKTSTSQPTSSFFAYEYNQQAPPLPEKIPNESFYQNLENNSTANILHDLKALQEEVDKIRDYTGGF